MSDQSNREGLPPFQFVDPQEAKVYEHLMLIGQGPASMFRDACAIMYGRFDLITATHIVGHLLREVLGAILGVLIPPEKESELEGKGANAQKAKFALEMLGFSQTDFVWHFWVKRVIRGDCRLDRFAHRGPLFAPRKLNAEFRDFWADFVEFLDQLLNAIRNRLLEISRPFEELARKSNPTSKDIGAIAERLPHHPVYLKRFLDNIESPEWIELLDDRRYFDGAPRAVVIDGMLRADPWPQGQFLVRMAPMAPKKISEILQRVEWPWNPYIIFRDTIDIIKSIDVPNARPLVVKLLSWIDEHGLSIVDHYVGELTEHLGRNGAGDLALSLAERLLAFDDKGQRRHVLSGPPTVVEEYTFERTVATWIEPTLQKLPLDTLKLLCNTLRDGLTFVASDFTSPELIFEMRGCELVNDDRPRTLYGVLSVVACAIRDHACTAIESGTITLGEICDLLDQYEPGIFIRLKFCVVARNVSGSGEIMHLLLLNREHFFAPWMSAEYDLVAAQGYTMLTSQERSRFLTMVARIPPYVEDLTGERKESAFELWQISRLAPIVTHLPPEWRRRYDELDQKHGDALRALNEGRMRGWHWNDEENSQVPDNLAQMEIGQVIELVESRQPKQGHDSFSRHELHRAIEQRVAIEPQVFAQNVQLLIRLNVGSIRWFFSGLLQAVHEKRRFEWPPVIEFSNVVYEQSLAASDDASEDGRHVLTELRKSVLSLLEAGIDSDDCRLPDELLGKSLEIILKGMRDADPSPAADLTNTSRGRAIQAAINCARGIAFDTLYHFIDRIKSSDERRTEYWIRIRIALDEYLEQRQSQRLAVHAMLGRLFPILWTIDRNWIMTRIDDVFPPSEDRRKVFAASWEGYVGFWRPSKDLFADLRPCYVMACDHVAEMFERGGADPSLIAIRTAGHIVDEYGRQTINLGDKDGLIERLFSNAATNERREALRIAGELWSSTCVSDPQGKAYAERMQQLYEWRFNECQKCADSAKALEEVWAIDNWPSDGFADVNWWLDRVLSILTTWNTTSRNSRFALHLAECASDYPEKVIAIIERIVDANHPEWAMAFMHKYIKDAFRRILSRDRTKYAEKIRQLVNRFSTRSVTGFDDLLA